MSSVVSNLTRFVFPSVPGYITAELEPVMVPNTVDFVIGDGEVIGGFTNQVCALSLATSLQFD